jgi:predicted dehydrogenase
MVTGHMKGAPGVLRFGVLGATAYISGLLIPAIRATEGCRLAALASRPASAPRARALAAEYGTDFYPDYEALVTAPDIDAVYIALPNSQHTVWTTKALMAGKHVLVEKPLSDRLGDIEVVRTAAAKAGRVVMEAFMYRFHTQQDRAADLLASGLIGRLVLIRASFAYPIPSGSDNIRLVPELGGGATWDVGGYPVNVATMFFGDAPESVVAWFATRPGERVETSAVGVLDFSQQRRAIIDYSIDYGPRAGYELQGERGSIEIANAWAFASDPCRITVRTLDGIREEIIPPVDHYQRQVAAFVKYARDGGPSPYGLGETEVSMRVCTGLVASARGGRPVRLDEDLPLDVGR